MSPNENFRFEIQASVARKDDRFWVSLEMVVTNNDPEPVFVNGRFAVAPVVGDVQLSVTAPDGNVLPFKFRVRVPKLGVKEFVELKSGESLNSKYPLSRGYGLKQSGKYKVTATYTNQTIPDELAEKAVVTGAFSAEPTAFTIPS